MRLITTLIRLGIIGARFSRRRFILWRDVFALRWLRWSWFLDRRTIIARRRLHRRCLLHWRAVIVRRLLC